MANRLMFEVGIKKAQDDYERIKKDVEDLASLGKKGITIKVALEQVGNLAEFTQVLAKLGDPNTVKPLAEAIASLKQQLVDLGKGSYTNAELDGMKRQAEAAKQKLEEAQAVLTQMDRGLRALGDNAPQFKKAERADQADKIQKLREEYEKLNAAYEKASKSSQQTNAATFKTSTADVAAYEAQVKALQEQLTALENKTRSLGETTKQATKEMSSATEKKGSKSAQLANVERLDKELERLKPHLEELKSKYQAIEAIEQSLGRNLGSNIYQSRIEAIQTYIKALESAKTNEELISKRGGLGEATYRSGDTERTIFGAYAKSEFGESALRKLQKELENLILTQERAIKANDAFKSSVREMKISDQAGFVSQQQKFAQEYESVMARIRLLQTEITQGQKVGANTTMSEVMLNRLTTFANELDRATKRKVDFANPADVRLMNEEFTKLARNAEIFANVSKGVARMQGGLNTDKLELNNHRLTEAKVLYSQLEEKLHDMERAERQLGSDKKLQSSIQAAKDYLAVLRQIIDAMGNKAGKQAWDIRREADFRKMMPDARDNVKILKEEEKASQAAAKNLEIENRQRQSAVQTLRAQAEQMMNARRATLQGQSGDLMKLLSLGKDKLGTEQYEAVRNALRAIREELRQIDSIMQRGGRSTSVMFSLGGNDRDYSKVIQTAQATARVREQGAVSTERAASATSRLTAEEQRLAQAIGSANQHMRGQSQIMSDLKMLATQYLGVWGAQGFLRNVIEIGGQLEMQRMSIAAILGDAAKANELFDRIKLMAVKSPFGVVELDQMTKQLSAYGFEYNELFDMTKRLADISAATGTSVDRLALALGHVRSEAALSGYTLRQFSMANIPLAKKLSEELTKAEGKFVSVAEVRKRVRAKDIGYEDVLKVLKDLTNEGGMFYNAQEKMSENVKARFKNLKDSMDIMYGEIAESKVGKGLEGIAKLLTVVTRHWQEVGAVLLAGAGYWAISRMATVAANKAIVQYNLTTGRFNAAQLEAQAITGNLTRKQLLQAVATKKLSVETAEAAGAVLGLSRAQLQHVANTGKATAANNLNSLSMSKLTVHQLRMVSAMKEIAIVGPMLTRLTAGFFTLGQTIATAARAVAGFMSTMWPMLAISAIVEIFMSAKQEAEEFADAANYVGQSARQMMADIDKAMDTVTKNGKPINTEALRESVETMKEVLEQSEFYTAEQQREVENAKTLSQKYDVLLKQMKEMKQEAQWQADSEGFIKEILENTGRHVEHKAFGDYFGSRYFNDSLTENAKDVGQSTADLNTAISLLAEYQNVMAAAIEKNNNFGLSLDGKSWQEQIRIIARSGHWDEFVDSVENAGSRFKGMADNVKENAKKVGEDWENMGDDFEAVRLTLMKKFNLTEEGLNEFAKNNERIIRWMVDGIMKTVSRLGLSADVLDEIKQKLLNLFNLGSGKATQKPLTDYDLQTDLGKRILGNVIRHNRNNGQGGNGILSVKDVNKITGTGKDQKSETEVIKSLKETAQKDYDELTSVEKIWGKTSKRYEESLKKYNRSLNIAESNGIKRSEIEKDKNKKKGSGRNGNKNQVDEETRELREKVRILKEAADSYKYWRDKVGQSGAFSHVEGEFGDLLGKNGLTSKNIEDLRGNLERLRKEIESRPNSKAKTEALKEIEKELAQLDRKDFEKQTEKFVSKVNAELDALTRAWEIFNNVREATGSVRLAVQLSGADYSNGKHRNLADALRDKIEKDFEKTSSQYWMASVPPIDFNMNLSDEAVKEMIQGAFTVARPEKFESESDTAYGKRLSEFESKISGFIEMYKRWRDLQRDVVKEDLQMFGQLLGSVVDYQSELQKIDNDYNTRRVAIDAGFASGNIDAKTRNRMIGLLDTDTESKRWQKSTAYITLMNNSLAMTRQEIEAAAMAQENDLNRRLEKGLITAEDYVAEITKLSQIRTEWGNNGFLGQNGAFGSFISGGNKGLMDYYQRRANKAYTEYANAPDKDSPEAMEKLEEAQRYEKLYTSLSKVTDKANDLVNAFQTLQSGVNLLGNLFDSMGWSGGANAMSDAGDLLGGALGGASALSGLGPWGMAAGAAVGLATSLFQLNDKTAPRHLDAIQDEVDALEQNTQAIRSARERTLGYDRGRLRSQLAGTYSNTMSRNDFWSNLFGTDFMVSDSAKKNMQEYYTQNSSGTGYKQELDNMKQQREKYLEMYNLENGKKKSSQDALDEYQNKIAELDDQIAFFVEDLTKELWGIDFKGWASQISDALWTAFENGEDAVKAFRTTASDIISDVANKMMNIHFIEPVFSALEDELFGHIDSNGNRVNGVAYNNSTGELNENAVLTVLGKFFGEGGLLEQQITAGQQFYDLAQRAAGFDFGSDEGSSSASSGIKSITEQTADLLASYINAIRADVSVNRELISTYFPMYYAAMTSGNESLRNIQNHTAAIMESNRYIAERVESIDTIMRRVTQGGDRLHVS